MPGQPPEWGRSGIHLPELTSAYTLPSAPNKPTSRLNVQLVIHSAAADAGWSDGGSVTLGQLSVLLAFICDNVMGRQKEGGSEVCQALRDALTCRRCSSKFG